METKTKNQEKAQENAKRHCGCGDREDGMCNCDYFFYDTDDYQRALEELENRKRQGQTAKIVRKNG
jgi:hypothetical protein